ncbi:hypothetical protein H2200_006834 [Cladophialophora chaetospira]|uniref:Uncharacterized protein n=1 Tax=Cladophialophora chaetospira TaxID=386627 RepID=A0AA38X8Y8_9EURO|nr:hypothetical protein H2200_006834 [Cladophialophora chaetospira]
MQPDKRQHPTSRARERGSPALPVRRRGRPSLSASRLTQFFFVDDIVETETGEQEEYTWRPHEVRFVLWYHVTTHLSYDAIAVAFNVTFGSDDGVVPEMGATNVQKIIDVIGSRSEVIDHEMRKRKLEPWPRPDEIGWIPCDHGMGCATLSMHSYGRVTSVVRSADLKTRSAREIADMATRLWEGPWEQLVRCPRRHEKPATTTPTYSPPTIGAYQRTPRPGERKQKPRDVITISDSTDSFVTNGPQTADLSDSFAPSAGHGTRFHPDMRHIGPIDSLSPVRQLRSSARKTGTNLPPKRGNTVFSSSTKLSASSSNKENRSPARSLRSASQVQAIEEESDVDWDEPASSQPVRSSSGAVSSGGGSYRTATARSTRTRSSANSSNYASARSQVLASDTAPPLPGLGTAPTKAVVNGAGADVQTIAPRRNGLVRAIFEFFGGSEALWFVLQQTIRGICLCLILNPYLEFLDENFDNPTEFLWARQWLLLPAQCLCTVLVGREIMTRAFERARSHIWRRWAIDISPPEAPHLSPSAYLLFMGVACGLTTLLCPRWTKRTWSLFHKLFLGNAAQEANPFEVFGSDDTT